MEFMMLDSRQRCATEFPELEGSLGSTHESVLQAACREVFPVRVALLTNFIPPYFLPVLREFSSMVSELHIFLSTRMEGNRDWQPHWDGLNVQVQKTFTTVLNRKHGLGFSSEYYLHLPYDTIARLRNCMPDVIISGQLGFRTFQSYCFNMLRPKTALVAWADLSEHTETGIGWFRRSLRKRLLCHSDAVLVNGQSGAKYVAQLRADSSRIVCMPFVRDMSDLLSIPLLRDRAAPERRLLYVGHLLEGKGVHLLLGALARWHRSNPNQSCELSIVGDGPMRKELEQLATVSGVKVRFLGSVPFERLRSVYASADIFVFPTLSDTWGVVVNEALAAGMPVLGSQLSQAVNELVVDGRNGWIFRPDRSEEFDARLFEALTTPPAVLYEMGRAGRVTVERLTPEFAAARMVHATQVAHQAAIVRVRQGS